MAAKSEIPFAEGRGGLKVPELTWSDWAHEPKDNILWYFHDFWSVNGLPPQLPSNNRNQIIDKPYSNELVVPANADKPLVYIRGSFQPRDPRLIEQESERQGNPRYDPEDGGWPSYAPVTTAFEEHSVATPPNKVGQFEVLLRVSKIHVSELSAEADPLVVHRGITVDEEDYFPKPFRDMTPAEANKFQAIAYKSALAFILQNTFIDYIT